jgi:hypothetical protein
MCLMWKKVVFAFAITGLLAATAVPLSAREYKHSGCADAAKMRFPEDRAARKEFKHWCKAQWKIYKETHP